MREAGTRPGSGHSLQVARSGCAGGRGRGQNPVRSNPGAWQEVESGDRPMLGLGWCQDIIVGLYLMHLSENSKLCKFMAL